jgi:FkbM family methyltransferase
VSSVLDRAQGSLHRMAKSIARTAGLERSPSGRRFLARLNVLGERLSRVFLLRGRPFTVDGHLIYLAGRSGPSISFSSEVLSQKYEQDTSAVLRTYLRPGMAVIDVGAHVGCHALLAARLVGPEGKVYAFEPSPDNFALLQKNVALNGYRNVELIPKAVAEKTGTVTFHLSPEGNDRNAIFESSRAARRGRSVQVQTVSLDDFLEQKSWPQVDLIKIDVEGAEPLVFEGMTRLLKRSTQLALIAEFAPACIKDGGRNPEDFLSQIANCGFHINALHGPGRATELDASGFLNFTTQIESEGMTNLFCLKVNNL